MAILGLGTDVVEIQRLAQSITRSGEAFLNKVYHPEELRAAPTKDPRRIEFLAGRWAVKEALAKALGTGITHQCRLNEICTLNHPVTRKPYVLLEGAAQQTAESLGVEEFMVSIAHDGPMATATVILANNSTCTSTAIVTAEESSYTITQELAKILTHRKWHMATAESCTGGLIAATITALPGSSQWFHGGMVTYHTSWKNKFLNVSPNTIQKFGVVSTQTVSEMATGLQSISGVECAVATSGIAGPGGAEAGKPVGTVAIAAATPNGCQAQIHYFQGNRSQIQQQATRQALQMLLEALQ